MFCKNCGNVIDENSLYCNNCGTRLETVQKQNFTEDDSSLGFAIIGFFIPLVGLILFLIYEGKKPKRAKSAGKGALTGFVTRIMLSIILVVLYFLFAASLFGDVTNAIDSNEPVISGQFNQETTDEILEKYIDVSFGEFIVTNNGYFSETSLDITVKNKAEKQCSYYITIEAIDAKGARIATDMTYVNKLNAGQEIYLSVFEYVEQDKINQLQNATFRVLEINKYDF